MKYQVQISGQAEKEIEKVQRIFRDKIKAAILYLEITLALMGVKNYKHWMATESELGTSGWFMR